MSFTQQTREWDSAFFGFPVLSVTGKPDGNEVEHLLREWRKKNIRLVYFFTGTDPETKNILLSYGAFLVDERIIYRREIRNEESSFTGAVEIYSDKLTPELIALAIESGQHSRFRKDKNFSTYEKLYTEWIANSLQKKIADYVFTIKQNDEIIGLLTMKINQPAAEIGLVAVDKKYRRKHLAIRLLDAAVYYAQKENCFSITVATQKENAAACALYASAGFSIAEEINIYHLWL